VDCRGHLSFDDTAGDDDAADLQSGVQLLVVVAWLFVKQAGLCLGHLVSSVHLEVDAGHGTSSPPWLLSATTVHALGKLLMDSLLSLKHIGAVKHTTASLQSLCTKLLAHGQLHTGLSALPSRWIDNLIDTLATAKHQVCNMLSALACVRGDLQCLSLNACSLFCVVLLALRWRSKPSYGLSQRMPRLFCFNEPCRS
jgi:hypothetical protein